MSIKHLGIPLTILALAIAGWLLEDVRIKLPEPPQVQSPRLTRPQVCAEFLREDPSEWDPETDTYPRNLEWESCIGVTNAK